MKQQYPKTRYELVKETTDARLEKDKTIKAADKALRDLETRRDEIHQRAADAEQALAKAQRLFTLSQAERVLYPSDQANKAEIDAGKKLEAARADHVGLQAALNKLDADVTAARAKLEQEKYGALLNRQADIRREYGRLCDEFMVTSDRRAIYQRLETLWKEYAELPPIIRKSGWPDYQRALDQEIVPPDSAVCNFLLGELAEITGMGIARIKNRFDNQPRRPHPTLRSASHLDGVQ